MKRTLLLCSLFFSFFIRTTQAQDSEDLISGGENSWIFHTPDWDSRTELYLAPKTNGGWNWEKQTTFYNDGNVLFSGNIGIGVGTFSPNTNLEIAQKNAGGGFRIGWGNQFNALFTDIGYPTLGGLVINAKANGDWAKMTFMCDDIQKMSVSKENVSMDVPLIIGTEKPTTNSDWKLAVDGKIMSTNLEVAQKNAGGGFRIGWGNQFNALFTDIGYPTLGGLVINAKANGDWAKMTFMCDDIQKMSVGIDNVSMDVPLIIGNRKPNTDTDWKLAVDGKIMSTEVKVTAPTLWADYVFEKEYKPLSLEEVESFVLKNKHLPEIPSAKEVEQNGINLGQMDGLLLKKIEELTLYMIDLKKENTRLNAANQELKTKLDGLAKQVNQLK